MVDFNPFFPHETQRPQQRQVLDFVARNWDDAKYFIIDAPTGVGKSALAMALSGAAGNSFVLTGTKVLQDQYEREYKVVNLKGRGNYTCNVNRAFKVDHAPCLADQRLMDNCKTARLCAYYNQRDLALSSKSMITSYAYFLSAVECGPLNPATNPDRDTRRSIAICDEAHEMEDWLVDFSSAAINPENLAGNLDVHIDADLRFTESGIDANMPHIERVYKALTDKLAEVHGKMQTMLKNAAEWAGDPERISGAAAKQAKTLSKSHGVLDRLHKRIGMFLKYKDDPGWIVEPELEGKQLRVTPFLPKRTFFQFMDPMADRFVFMSASIGDPRTMALELGLPLDMTRWISVGTPFNPDRSPIYPMPVAKLNFANIDRAIPDILDTIDAILEEHPDDKGIIHAGNYKLTKAILERAPERVRRRLIGKASSHGDSNEDMVQRHVQSPHPTVLVSPSMYTGIDLRDDLSRFQVIVKLPWLNVRDPRVAAKMNHGDWYANAMINKVIQASGRSTRSEDDRSVTYILDEQFGSVYNRHGRLMPDWFKERIRW